ncbi:MAG: T9SS type A sorting domain-containing protein [Bacteroidales bacterium]|jgi:hypothetical protein|nr:T9SS type A sorting domain-containing protein [Bacteroidales bacterium]
MKKTILLISFIIYSNLIFSQYVIYENGFISGPWPPEHFDSWLLPEIFQNGCDSLPLFDDEDWLWGQYTPGGNGVSNGMVCHMDTIQTIFSDSTPVYSNLSAFAQPYFIDSVISIKGVAIMGSYYPNGIRITCDKENIPDSFYYFQIRDSNFNVLAQVRYDTTRVVQPNPDYWDNTYKELFFDSTIFMISSKFYASVTFPYLGTDICLTYPLIGAIRTNDSCSVTEFPSGTQNHNDKDTPWEDFTQLGATWGTETPSGTVGLPVSATFSTICIFPILDTLVYSRDAIVEATNAEYNEITSSMNISIFPLDLGYPLPDSLGIVYIKSDSSLLDINNPLCNIISTPFISGQGVYNYEISFDSIICDTTYFFKPFIVNSNGIIYGQVDSFKKQCFNSGLINADNNENKITIHPNPAKDYIIIDCELSNKEALTFTLYDNKGIEVLSQELNNSKTTIDTRKFFSGAYYYRITNKQNKVIKSGKIILSK